MSPSSSQTRAVSVALVDQISRCRMHTIIPALSSPSSTATLGLSNMS